MVVERSVEGLRKSAKKKREETKEKVEKGIQQLIKEKRTINFNTVAQASGVSKAWLYKEADIKARIEYLREQAGSKKRLPAKLKASDASKDTLIRTLKEQIKKLKAENADLRRQNEVAYGHVLKARDLEKEVERLRSANERLRQNQPKIPASQAPISERLAELGVTMNSTLKRLVRETPSSIVETAIETLKEALDSDEVKNPGGFLNKAITNAWRPNEAYQGKVDMSEFNEWWKWAYGEGLVKAATQIDGVQHVLTKSNEWMPLGEAKKRVSTNNAHKPIKE